jgi:hypothetical protein
MRGPAGKYGSQRNLLRIVTVAMASLGVNGMYAQTTEREMDLFETGQRLGECLVRGCVVFTGVVQSVGDPRTDPGERDPQRAMKTRNVELKVSESLFGAPNGSSVQLLYATRPEKTKTALGPWLPWQSATVLAGRELLVARWAGEAPRATWMGRPEDIALVVSDKTRFAGIRAAISEHRRFERAPNEVAIIPRLIRDKQDDLFTGYALAYLMEGETARNVDRAATIMSQLIGNELVPPAGRAAMGNWFASTFYRLTASARQTATQALLDAASADSSVAFPAVSALIRLADLQTLTLPSFASDARRQRVVENYRAFLAQNKAQPPSHELESRLGLR